MSETLELNLGDRLKLLPWIAWGARHSGDVDDVIAAATDFSAVPAIPIRPKWEAFKASGDTIVGVIEDAPPFVQGLTLELTAEALQVEELKFGLDGKLGRFVKALPAIFALVSKFLPPGTGLDLVGNVIDVAFNPE